MVRGALCLAALAMMMPDPLVQYPAAVFGAALSLWLWRGTPGMRAAERPRESDA